MIPKIQVAGKSDKGLVRPANEDSLHLDRANNVFAVCDGMGGHQAGEVASMAASEILQKTFRHFYKELLNDPSLGIGRTLPPGTDVLAKSIRLANRTIYNRALAEPEFAGMGTTIVAVALEADIISVAHVGDSRVYRLDKDALVPLTRDHSWVVEMQDSQKLTAEEANAMVAKNVITRALGVKESVEVDLRINKVQSGDIFLLCSDGLCGFADDQEIFAVANKRRGNLEAIIDDLIRMANDRGGSDNVTVIALQVEEVEESPLPESSVFTLDPESPATLVAEDGWVARLSDISSDDEDTAEHSPIARGRNNSFLLLGIVAAFVVVAAAIIYFS